MIGFTYYNVPPSTTPTTQEILAALTGAQKLSVLDGFVAKTPITELKHKIGVSSVAIRHLYRRIDQVEESSRSIMRGEVLITPAVVDPQTGEIITPAVYNTPPETAGELLTEIQDAFSDIFTPAQITAILTAMVEYSKHDGTGDWSYYSAEVVK